MFRKQEQIVNVQDPNAQNSGQISAKDGNWFYSIFKPESSRNKGKEPVNVVAVGFANLIGGFLVILHELSELKSTAAANQKEERAGQYWKLLGRRANFGLHASVAIISYLLFGLLPPVIYGFSFRVSNNKEYKLIAVAAVSLLCIALLAIGRAHVNEPKSYIKTFLYYLGLGLTASGLSYAAGVMTERFLEQLGLFEHNAPFPSPPSVNLFGVGSGLTPWESE